MNGARQVLMLGLDAAERDTVLSLSQQGLLPNLKRILDQGVSGSLSTPATHYAGGVWPSFYTGQPVPWHGIFHNKLWRPEAMRVEVAGDDWISARPFWESLSDAGVRSCIVDVPMVLGRPRPVNGVTLAGWGTHDLICKGSWPADLWSSLAGRFGAPRMPPEHFGRQTLHSLTRLKQQLLETTDQLRDISIELLADDRWRFGCIVFGAIHRAGHYLLDPSQADDGRQSPHSASLQSALSDVYRNVDAAIGDILRHLPANTLVIVFSAHGMRPNPGWSDLLPDILAKIEQCRTGSPQKRGLLYALKRRIPHHWVRPALNRLPGTLNDRLVSIWSRRMFDWSRTRYFPMPMDEAGYVRINLRGREAQGIVEAGAEYDDICRQVGNSLAGLYDEATGETIAGEVVHAWRDADPAATCRRLLPDLIVPWRGPAASDTRRLLSKQLPGFTYDVPRRLPSGRSGNHTDNAWFAASGPGVGRARLSTTHSVMDLLPTILRYLDVKIDADIRGRPIELGARE